MATSDIEPRNLLKHPKAFGVDPLATWLSWRPELDDRVAVAYYQHLFMVEANKRLKQHRVFEGSKQQFAAAVGQNYYSVCRLFRGERFLSLEDALAWARALSSTIMPVYSTKRNMLPTKLTEEAKAEAKAKKLVRTTEPRPRTGR